MGKQTQNHLSALEAQLESIATRDISESGRSRMEASIDRLAGVDVSLAETGIIEKHPHIDEIKKPQWVIAAAAVAVLMLVLLGIRNQPDQLGKELSDAGRTSSLADFPGYTLLQSVHRVNLHQNDGLIIPTDGNVPHYRHQYHIVDEEKIRDAETGDVITIRQPRREIVTVPVTQF